MGTSLLSSPFTMALLWATLALLIVVVSSEVEEGPAYMEAGRTIQKVEIAPRNESLYTAGECVPEYGWGYHCRSCSNLDGWKIIEKVAGWEHCGKICYENRGCTHWSYNHYDKQCRLQNHNYDEKYTHVDVITGQ